MWFECEHLPALIDEWWKSFEVSGPASYSWWSRIKLLKDKLRAWNRDHFGRVDKLITSKVVDINEIDVKEETTELTEDEIIYRAVLKAEL
ncbi:hypothetical protein FRX31_011815, partial [Thalictrum thalictroides]